MSYQLSMTDTPDAADCDFIRQGLAAFNLQHAPDDQHQQLVVLARDEQGALAGGLLGGTYWGWLHIEILWVREDTRGQGLGKQLMAAASTGIPIRFLFRRRSSICAWATPYGGNTCRQVTSVCSCARTRNITSL